jgi:monovalent cation:H+ antiporter, CPA1 family
VTLPQAVLELSGLLTLAVFLGLLARRVHVPLTVVLVVVALIGSGLGLTPSVAEIRGETFEQVVVFAFLPLLVFSAALGSDVRAVMRNLTPIVALAVPAFLVSAVLVGSALHLVLGTGLLVALLFGALISATDPVAVVAVFREVGVPRRLLVLVEGESLLNDGVAIVLFTILLEAALGGDVTVGGGLLDFVVVAVGGALVGVVLGLVAAAVLPWLDRLPAAALSLAAAYGTFALADEVLGLSGVVATAAAGLTLAGVAPTRASAAVRETWEQMWEALDYVANALLFLLIGLVLEPSTLLDNLGAIGLTVVVVLVARALGVVPVVWLLERFAHIPRVGRRNEAVLVWGGLRGGVALALALALPEDLADRDLLVALTGGVVLATLLVNATTVRRLVHRLGLDTPTRAEQFLAVSARLSGIEAARQRVAELGLYEGEAMTERLDAAEREAREELHRLELSKPEEQRVVTGRGLHVERETYQRLSDSGLLPNAVTRSLLHEVDDEIDEMTIAGSDHEPGRGRSSRSRFDRLLRRLLARLPAPPGADPEQLAYAEATARWIAARRTADALELFDSVPAVQSEAVERSRKVFTDWEREATSRLEEIDAGRGEEASDLHRRQTSTLARAASGDELTSLVRAGLLPESVAARARSRLGKSLKGRSP